MPLRSRATRPTSCLAVGRTRETQASDGTNLHVVIRGNKRNIGSYSNDTNVDSLNGTRNSEVDDFGLHYVNCSSLPPFVALYTSSFAPGPMAAENITILISDVVIAEPSLGSETNSIVSSRAFNTPCVAILASSVFANITVALRNVTLSHGGVRDTTVADHGSHGRSYVRWHRCSSQYFAFWCYYHADH